MLEYQVNILVVLGPDDVVEADDVLVFELFEEHDFPVGSLGIRWVCECVEVLLKRFQLLGFTIGHFPYNSVSSTSYFFDWLVKSQNVGLNIVRHSNLLISWFIYTILI